MKVTGNQVEIRSVSKAIRLLEELSKEPGVFGVSELARAVEMDKSSVSRMLKTLEQSGCVAQDATTQRYQLGVAMAVFGQKALKRLNVRNLAQGPLERIARHTGECAHLAILAAERAFYVEQAAPLRGVSVEAPIGTLAPLHCTALGKVLLAYQPRSRQEAMLEQLQCESFTRRTITDVAALRAHLVVVRETGLGLDDEEFSVGVRCIAAPVFRHDGSIAGAIGISGPSPRVTDDRLKSWGEYIKSETDSFSAQLGFREVAPDLALSF